MNTLKRLSHGWPLVLCIALAVALFYCTTLLALGYNEESVRVLVRASARSSFGLFTCAFVAQALHTLWPGRSAARWARDNYPFLLVSLAVSHTFHALALAGLAHVTRGESLGQREITDYVGGGLAYALMYAMAATSFSKERGRAFQVLHESGMYYVWIVFMSSYGGRAIHSLFYVPFALVLVAALALRVLAALRPRPLARAAG